MLLYEGFLLFCDSTYKGTRQRVLANILKLLYDTDQQFLVLGAAGIIQLY